MRAEETELLTQKFEKAIGSYSNELTRSIAEKCTPIAVALAKEEAVAFAEWAARSYLHQNTDRWYKIQDASNTIYTTEQLYSLFKQK